MRQAPVARSSTGQIAKEQEDRLRSLFRGRLPIAQHGRRLSALVLRLGFAQGRAPARINAPMHARRAGYSESLRVVQEIAGEMSFGLCR